MLCSLVWCGCSFSVRATNSFNTTSKSLLKLEDFGVGLETRTDWAGCLGNVWAVIGIAVGTLSGGMDGGMCAGCW